jgi:pilus assembly protein Flp/PilA
MQFYLISNLYKKGGERKMLFLPREEGQGLVEYALILVLVAIVVIVVLGFLGDQVSAVFTRVTEALQPN